MTNSADLLKVDVVLDGSDLSSFGSYENMIRESFLLAKPSHRFAYLYLDYVKCNSMQNLIKMYHAVQDEFH